MKTTSQDKTALVVEVAQMRPIPANVRANLETMQKAIAEARTRGAEMIVFPELATSGYLLGDRWEHESFLQEIESANEVIRTESGQGTPMTIVWGSLRVDPKHVGTDGRTRKYNAVFIARNGEWVGNGTLSGWIPKTNMPEYGIFDDARYFYPAEKLAQEKNISIETLLSPFVIPHGGGTLSLGLTVCEDIWDEAYLIKPTRIYAEHGVDLLINVSSSPWTLGKRGARERVLASRVRGAGIPILYVNAVGLQNNTKNLVWFDGGSLFIDRNHSIEWRGAVHHEGQYHLEIQDLHTVVESPARIAQEATLDIEDIFVALIEGMRSFFPRGKKVVIGLSGGIDSAVSVALLVEALGRDSVIAVNMPTEYNSKTTRSLAEQCAKNLGIKYLVVPIQELYEVRLQGLAHVGYSTPPMLVKENIQARERGSVLASIAACEDGMFVNNGNKTEVALNYFTLYGDAAGAAAFLGDLWKGQVYELAEYINRRSGREIIPQGIIDIVPSAELSKDQNVDEGKGDPIFYPYHDRLLRMFAERQWDAMTALKSLVEGTLEADIGCESGTLRKYFSLPKDVVENLEWAWARYNMEFKRGQLPPVFITSRRAFGFDWRGIIASAHISKEYEALKERYLASTKTL